MEIRIATCQCGALSARCEGEPVRISVCHCLNCQQRSGSAFAVQARFPVERVMLNGERQAWTRTNQDGYHATFHFCPVCASTIAYALEKDPGRIAIPVGAFADPTFPAPTISVYESRQHPWLTIHGEDMERYH